MGGMIAIGYKDMEGNVKCYDVRTNHIRPCFSTVDLLEKGVKLIDQVCSEYADHTSDKAFFSQYGIVFYDEASKTVHTCQNYTSINQINLASVHLDYEKSKPKEQPDYINSLYYSNLVLLKHLENKTVKKCVSMRFIAPSGENALDKETFLDLDKSPLENLNVFNEKFNKEYDEFKLAYFPIENELKVKDYDNYTDRLDRVKQALEEISVQYED